MTVLEAKLDKQIRLLEKMGDNKKNEANMLWQRNAKVRGKKKRKSCINIPP